MGLSEAQSHLQPQDLVSGVMMAMKTVQGFEGQSQGSFD